MKPSTAVPVIAGTLWLCFATEPLPFAGELALLDRVSDEARPGSRTGGAALKILELVALGRMDAAAPGLEEQVGLPAGQLRGKSFGDSEVRAHALLRIGNIDLPDAIEFLETARKEDFEPDPSGRVWPVVSVALYQAQLNRIQGESPKISFLEDALSEWNAAAGWAADELCDRGSSSSLPLIRASIHRRLSTPQDANDEIGFCERRISALSRSPDRITALGSLLSTKEGSTDRRLLTWAIDQLFSMNSDRADAELRRYAAEIDSAVAAMADTPSKWLLARTRNDINTLLAKRTK